MFRTFCYGLSFVHPWNKLLHYSGRKPALERNHSDAVVDWLPSDFKLPPSLVKTNRTNQNETQNQETCAKLRSCGSERKSERDVQPKLQNHLRSHITNSLIHFCICTGNEQISRKQPIGFLERRKGFLGYQQTIHHPQPGTAHWPSSRNVLQRVFGRS